MVRWSFATLLALLGPSAGRQIASHKGLHVDVYHSVPEGVVYQNSTDLEFSPTAFTLIHGKHSAVLVDAPATINHSNQLADWVQKTIQGKNLTAIYITHGHGDHFLGASIFQDRFPGVKVYTTNGVLQHVKEELDPGFLSFYWESLFPNQIPQPTFAIETLPANGEFMIDGHVLRAVEVGQGDIMNATVLHVPDLDLVVTGDVVYGNCFQMFEETNTTALQDLWIQSIENVQALRPKIVIPSHMHPDEEYGTDHLHNSKQYIMDWKAARASSCTWQDLERKMKKRYPERTGSFILRISAQTEFNAEF